jgi:hypothetical protein
VGPGKTLATTRCVKEEEAFLFILDGGKDLVFILERVCVTFLGTIFEIFPHPHG